MAKALLGHLVDPSALRYEETVYLRRRIRTLEAEVADLQRQRDLLLNDGLRQLADPENLVDVSASQRAAEPAPVPA